MEAFLKSASTLLGEGATQLSSYLAVLDAAITSGTASYSGALVPIASALGLSPATPAAAEAQLLAVSALAMVALAVATFAALAVYKAPYGKFAEAGGSAWGPGVPARFAWLLQEAPSFVLAALAWRAAALAPATAKRALTIAPATVALAAFSAHYAYRSFVYPLRIRGGKATPVGVFLLATAFTAWNGWMQARQLAAFPGGGGGKASAALLAPRFVAGMLLWATGLGINLQADHILRTLRKPGETGYKIPRGGAFELVSGANYWGEILEWAGWAVAAYAPLPAAFATGTWLGALAATPGVSLLLHPATAFAIFTFANIGPRGAQAHAWYVRTFKDYPKDRHAVIPFVW